MESSKKIKVTFDGKTDVKNFLTKVELESSLKDYADEKKANFRPRVRRLHEIAGREKEDV